MRSPTMIKKNDRMPDYYPVYEDLATPLGLASKLDPNAKVIRMVGETKSIKKIKDQQIEKEITDGYGKLRVTRYGGNKAEYVLDCLDQFSNRLHGDGEPFFGWRAVAGSSCKVYTCRVVVQFPGIGITRY